MIALEEDDNTMYADIDRLLYKNNKFFILDRFGNRTAVAFTGDGKPFAHYGNVGQGPGEYVTPWDIAVDDKWVYILDPNRQKILKYHETGEFMSERQLPFHADAFKILSDKNFLFNIMPEGGEASAQICITDSTLKPLRHLIPAGKGYVGGWMTNDILRQMPNETLFYRAPADTLYRFNNTGHIEKSIVFDFNGNGVPELAKTDFLAARAKGFPKEYIMLANTPIPMNDSIWVGLITNDDSQYTILFDIANNKCGGRKFDEYSSVYDMIEPLAGGGNGNVISVLDEDLATRCKDYNALDNDIKDAMKKGNRVMVIHSMAKLSQSYEK